MRASITLNLTGLRRRAARLFELRGGKPRAPARIAGSSRQSRADARLYLRMVLLSASSSPIVGTWALLD